MAVGAAGPRPAGAAGGRQDEPAVRPRGPRRRTGTGADRGGDRRDVRGVVLRRPSAQPRGLRRPVAGARRVPVAAGGARMSRDARSGAALLLALLAAGCGGRSKDEPDDSYATLG